MKCRENEGERLLKSTSQSARETCPVAVEGNIPMRVSALALPLGKRTVDISRPRIPRTRFRINAFSKYSVYFTRGNYQIPSPRRIAFTDNIK